MNVRSGSVLATLCLAGAVVIGLAGCESADNGAEMAATAPDASMGVINERCPMMGTPVSESVATAEYKGYTIGFCCDGCPDAWERKSAEEKDEMLAQMLQPNMGVIDAKETGECASECPSGAKQVCPAGAEAPDAAPGTLGEDKSTCSGGECAG